MPWTGRSACIFLRAPRVPAAPTRLSRFASRRRGSGGGGGPEVEARGRAGVAGGPGGRSGAACGISRAPRFLAGPTRLSRFASPPPQSPGTKGCN